MFLTLKGEIGEYDPLAGANTVGSGDAARALPRASLGPEEAIGPEGQPLVRMDDI